MKFLAFDLTNSYKFNFGSGAHSKSSQICMAFFIKVDVTFGKVLSIWHGKSHSKYIAIAHAQNRFHFCASAGECFLKNAEQNV